MISRIEIFTAINHYLTQLFDEIDRIAIATKPKKSSWDGYEHYSYPSELYYAIWKLEAVIKLLDCIIKDKQIDFNAEEKNAIENGFNLTIMKWSPYYCPNDIYKLYQKYHTQASQGKNHDQKLEKNYTQTDKELEQKTLKLLLDKINVLQKINGNPHPDIFHWPTYQRLIDLLTDSQLVILFEKNATGLTTSYSRHKEKNKIKDKLTILTKLFNTFSSMSDFINFCKSITTGDICINSYSLFAKHEDEDKEIFEFITNKTISLIKNTKDYEMLYHTLHSLAASSLKSPAVRQILADSISSADDYLKLVDTHINSAKALAGFPDFGFRLFIEFDLNKQQFEFLRNKIAPYLEKLITSRPSILKKVSIYITDLTRFEDFACSGLGVSTMAADPVLASELFATLFANNTSAFIYYICSTDQDDLYNILRQMLGHQEIKKSILKNINLHHFKMICDHHPDLIGLLTRQPEDALQLVKNIYPTIDTLLEQTKVNSYFLSSVIIHQEAIAYLAGLFKTAEQLLNFAAAVENNHVVLKVGDHIFNKKPSAEFFNTSAGSFMKPLMNIFLEHKTQIMAHQQTQVTADSKAISFNTPKQVFFMPAIEKNSIMKAPVLDEKTVTFHVR